MQPSQEFFSDKDIARMLRMSPEWVRGQRHKRKRGLPCVMDLEPRYIGSCARYPREKVEAFLDSLKG